MASYKIQSGDTLGKIAARNGMSVSELARLNGIANPNKIRAGQVIKLPASANAPPPVPRPRPTVPRQTMLDSLGASGGVRLSSGKTGAIDAQRTPSVDAMTQAILQSGASGLGAANDPRTSALASPSFAFDLNPPNLPLNAPIAQGTGRYWGPNTDRWGPMSPGAIPAHSTGMPGAPQYAAMLQPAAYRVPDAFQQHLSTGAQSGNMEMGAPASGPALLQNASMFSDPIPSRSVQTVQIDPRTGNPIPAAAPFGLLQQGQAAYDARANAGQVQTPGLVDWGGIGKAISDTASGVYDHFQGQYNQRQARDALVKSNSSYRQIPGAGNASTASPMSVPALPASVSPQPYPLGFVSQPPGVPPQMASRSIAPAPSAIAPVLPFPAPPRTQAPITDYAMNEPALLKMARDMVAKQGGFQAAAVSMMSDDMLLSVLKDKLTNPDPGQPMMPKGITYLPATGTFHADPKVVQNYRQSPPLDGNNQPVNVDKVISNLTIPIKKPDIWGMPSAIAPPSPPALPARSPPTGTAIDPVTWRAPTGPQYAPTDPRAIYDAFPNNPSMPVTSGFTKTGWNAPTRVASNLTPSQQNANDIVVSRPSPVATPPRSIDTTNALDFSRLGISRPLTETPAQQAITHQVVNPAYTAWKASQTAPLYAGQAYTAGGGNAVTQAQQNAFGGLSSYPVAPPIAPPPQYLTVPAPPGPRVTAPWASLRYGIPATPRPGMVTSGVAPHPGGVLGFIGSLFGGAPSVPRVPGYNGKTSVTSDQFAGANQGFGGNNALMPDSMNSSRWLTGY